MSRLLAAPVVLVLAAGGMALLWPPGSSTLDAAVEVVAAGCGPEDQLGTGVVVATERVATVAHTVAGARELAVRTRSGRRYEAELLALDLRTDLALLAVDSLGVRALPLGEAAPGQRGRLLRAGAADRPFRVSRRIRARTPHLHREGTVERDALEIGAAVDPGDSGAALLDGADAVVGIVFAASRHRERTAYAVAASELERLLSARPAAPTSAGACP